MPVYPGAPHWRFITLSDNATHHPQSIWTTFGGDRFESTFGRRHYLGLRPSLRLVFMGGLRRDSGVMGTSNNRGRAMCNLETEHPPRFVITRSSTEVGSYASRARSSATEHARRSPRGSAAGFNGRKIAVSSRRHKILLATRRCMVVTADGTLQQSSPTQSA